jgi:alkylation response protein AidB-like acyl-CoA dehydrogenase
VNITFSAEHEAFRDQVRGFLEASLTNELRDAQRRCPGIFLDYEHNIVWHRILFRQGWIAPAWPREYGGTGWDLTRRYMGQRIDLGRCPEPGAHGARHVRARC